MKKFIIASIAASILATPAMAAPTSQPGRAFNHSAVEEVPQRQDDRGRFDSRGSFQRRDDHRDWKNGDRFEMRYAQGYRMISNPRSYGLRDAPRGYRWIQTGHDALLIRTSNSMIVTIVNHMFR